MRLNDLSDGSVKTLLILLLLAANIAIALAHHDASLAPLGSASASPAVSRASRGTFPAGHELFGEAPKKAGEALALPGQPPRQP